MACGIVIDSKNVDKFQAEMNNIAKETIVDKDLYPTLDVDINVELSDLTENLIEELNLLMPFGPGNPRPIFSSKNAYLKLEPRRIARNGIKMWVTDDKVTCEALSFRAGDVRVPSKGSRIDLAYSPSINTWQGVSSLQLDLKDFKIAL